MPELLRVLEHVEHYIDYAEGIVLPLLRRLQRQQKKGVRAGLVADWLGVCRRQAYNYLRALEIVGLARLEGKRWKAA